ncbi:hypothetical protein Btru_001612 [Bulinus truncatus]|nr:hypothetical protein Btru_001612 [Bulinus truncatus]
MIPIHPDCAEVSATALPSENELHLPIKTECLSSIVESLFAEFDEHLESKDAKISDDHIYSLKQELCDGAAIPELGPETTSVGTLESEKNFDLGAHQVEVPEPSEDQFIFPQPASSTYSQNESLDLDKVEAEIMELILEAEALYPASINTSTAFHDFVNVASINTSTAFHDFVAGDCVMPECELLPPTEVDHENAKISEGHAHTWRQGSDDGNYNLETTSLGGLSPEIISSEASLTEVAAQSEDAASSLDCNSLGFPCLGAGVVESILGTEDHSHTVTDISTPCQILCLGDVAEDSILSETKLEPPLETDSEYAKIIEYPTWSLRQESDDADSEAHQELAATSIEGHRIIPQLISSSDSQDAMGEAEESLPEVVEVSTSCHVLSVDDFVSAGSIDVETELTVENRGDAKIIIDHDYCLTGDACVDELNSEAASLSLLDSVKISGSEVHDVQVSASIEGQCAISEFSNAGFTCLDKVEVPAQTDTSHPSVTDISPVIHNMDAVDLIAGGDIVLEKEPTDMSCQNTNIDDHVYNLRKESDAGPCIQEPSFGFSSLLTLDPEKISGSAVDQQMEASIAQEDQCLIPHPAISRDVNLSCLDRNRVEAGVTQMLETLACRSTLRARCHILGSDDRLVSEAELERLQSQQNDSNYKDRFELSLLAIEELKAERNDLLTVADDIEASFILQSKYKDLLDKLASKLQNSTRLRIAEINRLESELEDLRGKCVETQKENKKLHTELKNMDDLLNRNHTCLAEMETLYRQDQEHLTEYRQLISQYTDEIALTTEALEEVSQTKETLMEQLTELQRSEAAANLALKASEIKIKELECELLETKQILDVSTQSKSKKEGEFENIKSKLEMYINELQHALDTLELEKDVIEQDLYECRESMVGDRIKLEDLTEEVEALRKIKATAQSDRETIKELKNVNRLLEEEKQLCMEAISDYRNKLEAEIELNSSNEQLIEALRRNNSEIQESYDQLMSEMQFVEASLTLKTSDLDSSCIALQMLEERMNDLLSNLQEKLGQDVKGDASKQRMSGASPNRSCLNRGDSFVALVLAHSSQSAQVSSPDKFSRPHASFNYTTNSLSDTHFCKQTNIVDGHLHTDGHALDMSGLEPFSPEPKLPTGCTKNSAHKHRQTNVFDGDFYTETALGKDNGLNSHCSDTSGCKKLFSYSQKSSAAESARKLGSCSNLVPGFASIRSIPSTSARALENRIADNTHASFSIYSSLQASSTVEDYQPLVIKIQAVEKLFNKLEASFSMVEKVNQLNLTDLKFDMETLSMKLNSAITRESQLSSELSKKCQMLSNAKDEIKELNGQVIDMKHILLKFQDQSYDISRLEEDKAELRHQVRDLKGQVSLLTEQLSEAIEKHGSTSKKDKDAAQEIVSLKKMNHELTMKLFGERDKHNELGEKAMKRMKVLETNWKKAEQEVQRFDDLVEKIRQACIDSHCQSTVPVVLHIVRLIDGMA